MNCEVVRPASSAAAATTWKVGAGEGYRDDGPTVLDRPRLSGFVHIPTLGVFRIGVLSFYHLNPFLSQPRLVCIAASPSSNRSPNTWFTGRLDGHNYTLSAVVASYQQPIRPPPSAISVVNEWAIKYLVNLAFREAVTGEFLHILVIKRERVNY